jgi:uncharacterized protein YgiM (DUF1202 family)
MRYHSRAMKRLSSIALIALAFACSTPAPAPAPAPEPPPVSMTETVIGRVRVSASALNVRESASGDAAVVMQVKKGTTLELLSRDESWSKVRLSDGRTGFASSRYLEDPNAKVARGSKKKAKKGSCQADSDFAFAKVPTPAFSDRGAHGTVVVDAWVGIDGKVTKTKLISNSTGDESLAFLTEREIKSAEFIAPVRDCAPRAFIYTYSRTF